MTWKVQLTEQARSMLMGISDTRVQRKLLARIKELAHDPGKQGKALTHELSGYRVVRAVGQRYRIVYAMENDKVIVIVVAMGIRKEGHNKDIYTLAKKLIRQGLLDSEDGESLER
jgi:mRNA interferase RelE/StbE